MPYFTDTMHGWRHNGIVSSTGFSTTTTPLNERYSCVADATHLYITYARHTTTDGYVTAGPGKTYKYSINYTTGAVSLVATALVGGFSMVDTGTHLWCVNFSSIHKIDKATMGVTTISVDTPNGVATKLHKACFFMAGYVWAVEFWGAAGTDQKLYRIDPTSNAVTTFTPAWSKVYDRSLCECGGVIIDAKLVDLGSTVGIGVVDPSTGSYTTPQLVGTGYTLNVPGGPFTRVQQLSSTQYLLIVPAGGAGSYETSARLMTMDVSTHSMVSDVLYSGTTIPPNSGTIFGENTVPSSTSGVSRMASGVITSPSSPFLAHLTSRPSMSDYSLWLLALPGNPPRCVVTTSYQIPSYYGSTPASYPSHTSTAMVAGTNTYAQMEDAGQSFVMLAYTTVGLGLGMLTGNESSITSNSLLNAAMCAYGAYLVVIIPTATTGKILVLPYPQTIKDWVTRPAIVGGSRSGLVS